MIDIFFNFEYPIDSIEFENFSVNGLSILHRQGPNYTWTYIDKYNRQIFPTWVSRCCEFIFKDQFMRLATFCGHVTAKPFIRNYLLESMNWSMMTRIYYFNGVTKHLSIFCEQVIVSCFNLNCDFIYQRFFNSST